MRRLVDILELLQRDQKGDDVHGLLGELFVGSISLDQLEQATRQASGLGLRNASWLFSELGKRAESRIFLAPEFLTSIDWHTRFNGIDFLISCRSLDAVEQNTLAVNAITDVHDAVARKAMRFVAVSGVEIQRSVLSKVNFTSSFRWLVDVKNHRDVFNRVTQRLRSSNFIEQRLAACVALEIGSQEALKLALSCVDLTARKFAENELEFYSR
jgi:hypothetical protein